MRNNMFTFLYDMFEKEKLDKAAREKVKFTKGVMARK